MTEIKTSPHTRGRQDFIHRALQRSRFIPSYEGQTQKRLRKVTSISIHPLLQGADRISAKMRQKSPDSSPPTRGRLALHFPGIIRRRLIPSREGQTHCFLIRHPVDCESSPPARGKRRSGNSLLCRTRFIPSYEGQTVSSCCKTSLQEIHPLIRGADALTIDDDCNVTDSSPHTRGRHPEIPFN